MSEESARVLPLRRPPVRQSTLVRSTLLLAWEPPHRFVMTWAPTPSPTEVELAFAALGPALTRVSVEHRGWESLTEEQLAQDCATPGGYTGGGFTRGWATILGRLAEAAESTPEETP